MRSRLTPLTVALIAATVAVVTLRVCDLVEYLMAPPTAAERLMQR